NQLLKQQIIDLKDQLWDAEAEHAEAKEVLSRTRTEFTRQLSELQKEKHSREEYISDLQNHNKNERDLIEQKVRKVVQGEMSRLEKSLGQARQSVSKLSAQATALEAEKEAWMKEKRALINEKLELERNNRELEDKMVKGQEELKQLKEERRAREEEEEGEKEEDDEDEAEDYGKDVSASGDSLVFCDSTLAMEMENEARIAKMAEMEEQAAEARKTNLRLRNSVLLLSLFFVENEARIAKMAEMEEQAAKARKAHRRLRTSVLLLSLFLVLLLGVIVYQQSRPSCPPPIICSPPITCPPPPPELGVKCIKVWQPTWRK
ncbi:hypothetical protein OC846_006920, partial [Tilletia horrida]